MGGIGSPEDAEGFEVCKIEGVDCTTLMARYGLDARFYAFPGEAFNPWLGVGFARNHLDFSVTVDDYSEGLVASGTDWVNLRLGGEFISALDIVGNVYVDYSFGQYDSIKAHGGPSVDVPEAARTNHHWLMLGGSFAWLL